MSDRTGAKVYMKKSTHLFNDYFNALLSVGLLVSSKAFRRLGIARPATHKLQFAGCISIIIMKLETVTSPAADKECPFPGSGQCYHGIRQKTRFQAGWADRFEGMRTVAALRYPIQSSVAMMAKGYYVSVPVGPSSFTLSMVERVLGLEPDGLCGISSRHLICGCHQVTNVDQYSSKL